MALLPPKKANWTKGTPQIGVFVRTVMGSTLEMCQDKATEAELMWALILMTGLDQAPPDLVKRAVLDWQSRTIEEPTSGAILAMRGAIRAKSAAKSKSGSRKATSGPRSGSKRGGSFKKAKASKSA